MLFPRYCLLFRLKRVWFVCFFALSIVLRSKFVFLSFLRLLLTWRKWQGPYDVFLPVLWLLSIVLPETMTMEDLSWNLLCRWGNGNSPFPDETQTTVLSGDRSLYCPKWNRDPSSSSNLDRDLPGWDVSGGSFMKELRNAPPKKTPHNTERKTRDDGGGKEKISA